MTKPKYVTNSSILAERLSEWRNPDTRKEKTTA